MQKVKQTAPVLTLDPGSFLEEQYWQKLGLARCWKSKV